MPSDVRAMQHHPNATGASVIPTVRYRNVPAAVAWLQQAFSFVPHRLVKDAKGAVLYAELTFGTGMVMVAPIQESPLGDLMVQPDEIGGVETQICYLFVDNAKAHYARAKAAGAEIVLDIEVEATGGRGYSCRDLEGHVWNFGTHNPWNIQTAASDRPGSRRTWKVLAACLLLAVTGALYLHKPARDVASHLALTILDKVSTSIEPALAEQTPDRGRATTPRCATCATSFPKNASPASPPTGRSATFANSWRRSAVAARLPSSPRIQARVGCRTPSFPALRMPP